MTLDGLRSENSCGTLMIWLMIWGPILSVTVYSMKTFPSKNGVPQGRSVWYDPIAHSHRQFASRNFPSDFSIHPIGWEKARQTTNKLPKCSNPSCTHLMIELTTMQWLSQEGCGLLTSFTMGVAARGIYHASTVRRIFGNTTAGLLLDMWIMYILPICKVSGAPSLTKETSFSVAWIRVSAL